LLGSWMPTPSKKRENTQGGNHISKLEICLLVFSVLCNAGCCAHQAHVYKPTSTSPP
jgi:hypothetical protein